MKPKTTLLLLKELFSTIHQKTVFILLSVFDKIIALSSIQIFHALLLVPNSLQFYIKIASKITAATQKRESIKSAPPEQMYNYGF